MITHTHTKKNKTKQQQQQQAVLSTTVEALEVREKGLRARLASEVEDSGEFQDLYYREQHKNESLAGVLAERGRQMELLKHLGRQKDAHIATLRKEKDRLSDRIRRLQEARMTERNTGNGAAAATAARKRDSSSSSHQRPKSGLQQQGTRLGKTRSPHPLATAAAISLAPSSSSVGASNPATDVKAPIKKASKEKQLVVPVTPTKEPFEGAANYDEGEEARTAAPEEVEVVGAAEDLGAVAQTSQQQLRRTVAVVVPGVPPVFASPVGVSEHGAGLLFTPPQLTTEEAAAVAAVARAARNGGVFVTKEEKKQPQASFTLFGDVATKEVGFESSGNGNLLVGDTSQLLAANALLAQLRRATRTAEKLAEERDVAVADRERLSRRCDALQVQLRNSHASQSHHQHRVVVVHHATVPTTNAAVMIVDAKVPTTHKHHGDDAEGATDAMVMTTARASGSPLVPPPLDEPAAGRHSKPQSVLDSSIMDLLDIEGGGKRRSSAASRPLRGRFW